MIKEESPEYTIVYLYNANSSPVGFKYRTPSYAEDVWDEYFYEKNLQGDIVAVYNATGTKLISYTYDAWGRFARTQVLSMPTTAIVNPYLYRGYYYDSDLGFYYLQSRYYDPNTCRFINADSYVSTGQGILGYNMFAYCNNNPVMYVDPAGNVSCTMIQLNHEIVYDEYYQKTPYQRRCVSYYTKYGWIYIYNGSLVDKKLYEDKIVGKYSGNAILVFDARKSNKDSPNMQIWNSHMIDESAKQREILEILVKHDQMYPSYPSWGRTVDSMLVEWDAHNDYYNAQFSIFVDTVFKWTTREQARCVDFDKNAEDFSYYEHFTKPLINKIID